MVVPPKPPKIRSFFPENNQWLLGKPTILGGPPIKTAQNFVLRIFTNDWLIDWLIEWLFDWLFDWLIDWLIFPLSYPFFEFQVKNCNGPTTVDGSEIRLTIWDV